VASRKISFDDLVKLVAIDAFLEEVVAYYLNLGRIEKQWFDSAVTAWEWERYRKWG
jgi:glutamine synthetase